MSRITNADPIKRGSSYTSTQLNQQFTEVNAAFPMDGDNVRNEGIDQPVFDLNNSHGKSGIILVAAASDNNTTPVTVTANTSAVSSPDAADVIQTWNVLQPITTTDLIRVYWQFDYTTTANDDSPVNSNDKNGCVWAVWLEYKDSGGSWHTVPNQGDFASQVSGSTFGSYTSQSYACTLVPHTVVLYDSLYTPANNPRVLDTYPSTGYGDWIYSPPSNLTIYGLRLMGRGLLSQAYDSLVGPSQNTWILLRNINFPQINIISRSHIAYLVMRKQ